MIEVVGATMEVSNHLGGGGNGGGGEDDDGATASNVGGAGGGVLLGIAPEDLARIEATATHIIHAAASVRPPSSMPVFCMGTARNQRSPTQGRATLAFLPAPLTCSKRVAKHVTKRDDGATVQIRFDQPPAAALEVNVQLALAVAALGRRCRNFKHHIHVSTAYVHQPGEQQQPCSLVPLPDGIDVAQLPLSEDTAARVYERSRGHHVNTYTWSKCIGEVRVLLPMMRR